MFEKGQEIWSQNLETLPIGKQLMMSFNIFQIITKKIK
jgi:hypothetical protein